MSSGLPTPLTKCKARYLSSSRGSAKSGKPANRGSKRTTPTLSHEHAGANMDGRHTRVWKACERCRMKKTKCNRELPCKRCKDDGLVCTPGSRRKTEYRQLPPGYAVVLENNHYTLIATVQKLYTMVRNGESWDLGEPEVNNRGFPVIHSIAEKLGCIQPSPDLPCLFSEDIEKVADIQTQIKTKSYNKSERKSTDNSVFSHSSPVERPSSRESCHSDLFKDYSQMVWVAQRKQQQQAHSQQRYPKASPSQISNPQFSTEVLYQKMFEQEPSSIADATAFGIGPILAHLYAEFQTQSLIESPMFPNDNLFSPWVDDFLAPPHRLDLTGMYMRQQQDAIYARCSIDAPSSPTVNPSTMASSPFMAGSDGTISLSMLDSGVGFDLVNQTDNIMFGDYEAQS